MANQWAWQAWYIVSESANGKQQMATRGHGLSKIPYFIILPSLLPTQKPSRKIFISKRTVFGASSLSSGPFFTDKGHSPSGRSRSFWKQFSYNSSAVLPHHLHRLRETAVLLLNWIELRLQKDFAGGLFWLLTTFISIGAGYCFRCLYYFLVWRGTFFLSLLPKTLGGLYFRFLISFPSGSSGCLFVGWMILSFIIGSSPLFCFLRFHGWFFLLFDILPNCCYSSPSIWTELKWIQQLLPQELC